MSSVKLDKPLISRIVMRGTKSAYLSKLISGAYNEEPKISMKTTGSQL